MEKEKGGKDVWKIVQTPPSLKEKQSDKPSWASACMLRDSAV